MLARNQTKDLIGTAMMWQAVQSFFSLHFARKREGLPASNSVESLQLLTEASRTGYWMLRQWADRIRHSLLRQRAIQTVI